MESRDESANPSDLLEALRTKALAIVERQRLVQVARALTVEHVEYAASLEMPTASPPDEIVTALRAPAGMRQVVRLVIVGRKVNVALESIGYPDPRRELRVWKEICHVVFGDAA